MIRVKVCGLTRMADAEAALEFGADALGFVLDPASPRFVGRHEGAAEIARTLGPYALCVAVFGTWSDSADSSAYAAVQAVDVERAPAQRRIRVFRAREDSTVEEALAVAHGMDGLLLDAYSPDRMGGTGLRVDLGFAAAVRESSSVPLILAGGLDPDNVAEAVRRVRPYAVDASSGLESAPGIKDIARMRAFVEAARA